MARTLDLGIVLFARDQASGPIRKVKLQVDGLTNSQGKQAKAAKRSADTISKSFIPALRGLAFAAAGAAAAIVKIALDTGKYEVEIRRAAFLTGVDTVEAFNKLDRTLRDMGKEFGILPIEVTKATQAIGRLGIRGGAAIETTRGALQLMAASAGELGAQGAVDLLAAAMRSFGLDSTKTQSVVDQLAKATTSTALDFKRLGLALGTASGFAANFGADLSQTLTLLGLTRDVIVRAERGATGVRNIFKDLSSVTKGLNAAAQGLNVTTTDQAGKFLDIVDISREVFARMKDMSDAQRSAFLNARFSVEAQGVLAALQERLKRGIQDTTGAMKTGIEAVVELNQQIKNADGTAQEFVDISLFGMAGAVRINQATWKDFTIELGRAINLVLVPGLRMLTSVVSFFTGILGKIGPVGRTIVAVLAGIGVMAGIISLPIIALSLAMGSWTGIATVAAIATKGLGIAFRFLLKPLSLVVSLLSIAAALAVAIANAFGADIETPGTAEPTEREERTQATVDQALAVATGQAAGVAGRGIGAAAARAGDDTDATAAIQETLRQFDSQRTEFVEPGTPAMREEGVVQLQPIIIQLDRRELGRAVIEFAKEERDRTFESNMEIR